MLAAVTNIARRVVQFQPGAWKASQSICSPSSRPTTSLPLADRCHHPRHVSRTFAQASFPFRFRIHNETKDIHFEPQGRTTSLNSKEGVLPSLWLRDNCRCSQCINQETMQRNFRIFENLDVEPEEASGDSHGLSVVWKSPVNESGSDAAPVYERHTSFYEWDFLERYLSEQYRVPPEYRWQLWGSEIAASPPTVAYEEIMANESDEGLARLMDSVARYGFVFVDNTPFDDAIHTERLLERIGPIRNTHYGGFYDFVPDMAKADTAYSNMALPAHTDTTYFTDPAGLQAFHLLSHTSPANAPKEEGASGGQSLLVDGYHAVEILKTESPLAFERLKRDVVPWHASGNEGIAITPGRLYPVFDIPTTPGEHLTIRWNNDDRGVLPTGLPNKGTDWIEAAAQWNQIVKRPDSEFWFQLRPGRTLIFDNHRVMHGRSAFTGLRRICGGYINRDDWVSRWRNTNLTKKEVRDQVTG